MFTGLIADLGTVAALDRTVDGVRLTIATTLAPELAPGDSVAVNGCCLTATALTDERFAADVMAESLQRTSLGALEPGATVNLELALRAHDRLGGHVVQGHVDGLGDVTRVEPDGFSRRVAIAPSDPALLRYVVAKGSIAIDGISLTVAAVSDDDLAIALIPETLERTTLGDAQVGRVVNLEVDVLAKYVEKLTTAVRS